MTELFSFLKVLFIEVFFKNTLTAPKIKDLVNIHTEKYDAIYDVINNSNVKQNQYEKEVIDISLLLPSKEPPSMKDELKSFLKKQMQTSNNINEITSTSTSIDLLDSKTQFSYLS